VSARKSLLTAQALDHVLEHGLLGLSLRPLAAALGTSDRMLIYHFGSKEGLITEVLQLASERLAGSLEEPDEPLRAPGDLVRFAWGALVAGAATSRLYLELCVLSLREPGVWAAAQQRIREPWLVLLREGLSGLGVSEDLVPALADLVLDSVDGLLLDRMVGPDPGRADAAALVFASLLDGVGS
jgi:AcrR family transcriptional regulator